MLWDMADRFRWGILGTGNIARQFARDLAALPDCEIAAVASRSVEKAASFCDMLWADRQGAGRGAGRETAAQPRALGSYATLLDERDLDAIYLSLPNNLHCEWTIRALEAGHHILCEKPLAMDVAEARQMFAAAHKAGRTLIEAFMYRCHPQTHKLLETVRRGEIGRVTHIRTSFCFHLRNTTGNIRLDPALGGGALLDVGCYCVNFSNLVAGAPVRAVHAASRRHESGVDMMTSALLEYEHGVQATFTCGMDAQSDNSAVISGTEGYITIAWPWKPTSATAGFTIARGIPPKQDLRPGEEAAAPPTLFVEAPADLPLYALEARAFVAACRGEAEPFVTEAESLATAEVLERIRFAAQAR